MRMVIATDLTRASVDAARYAMAQARRVGADLIVAHVVGSSEIDTAPVAAYRYQIHEPEPDARPVVDEYQREKLAAVKRWFHEAVGDPDGVMVSYEIAFGDLPEVLRSIVTDAAAESLTVGVRGHDSVGRRLSRILLDAPVPVVVVREGILGSD